MTYVKPTEAKRAATTIVVAFGDAAKFWPHYVFQDPEFVAEAERVMAAMAEQIHYGRATFLALMRNVERGQRRGESSARENVERYQQYRAELTERCGTGPLECPLCGDDRSAEPGALLLVSCQTCGSTDEPVPPTKPEPAPRRRWAVLRAVR